MWKEIVQGAGSGGRVIQPVRLGLSRPTRRADSETKPSGLTGACQAGGLPEGGGLASLVVNSSYQHNGARLPLDCRILWVVQEV